MDENPLNGRNTQGANEWKDSVDTVKWNFSYSNNLNCWAKLPESSDFSVGLNRFLHTATSWKDSIYIFGGKVSDHMGNRLFINNNILNDLICFNIVTQKWRDIDPQGRNRAPSPRYGHSAVTHNKSMMVFGGFSDPSNKNDVFEYRYDHDQWLPWTHIKGPLPPARTAHCSFVYNNYMYIFGGFDGNCRLDDMWRLKLDPDQGISWECITQHGDRHPPVLHSACSVIGNKLYIFSGRANVSLNDLRCFNLVTCTWSVVLPDFTNNLCAPEKRNGHIMVPYNKSLYIFGGHITDSKKSSDLYCFNTETTAWEIIRNRNKLPANIPTGISFHTATVIDNIIFICGGITSNSDNFFCFTIASFPKTTLNEDMLRLLQSKQLCDIVIKVGENDNYEEFSCHIPVLAARSSYLKGLIYEKLSSRSVDKSQPLLLSLPSLSAKAFSLVLRFIYSDRISTSITVEEDNIAVLIDVYRISAILKLTRLQKIATMYIQRLVSNSNALSGFEMAKKRSLDELVDVFESHILKDDNFDIIINRVEFEELAKSTIIHLIRKKVSNACPRPQQLPADTVYQTLEDDLKTLLDDTTLSDITLTIQGLQIRAHKAILAARCEYFRAMYRSLPPYNDNVGIRIGNMEPTARAFRSLMRFIYFSDTDISPEDSLCLFTADKFYGFSNNQLQAYCKTSVETNTNTSNVLEVLKASADVGNNDLKNHALLMIAENFVSVQPLPLFKTLSKDLILDINQCLVDLMKKKSKK